MIVRNIPFKDLDGTEQEIVKRHFKICMRELDGCKKLHSNLNDFWEAHREIDTNNGKYNGWKNE